MASGWVWAGVLLWGGSEVAASFRSFGLKLRRAEGWFLVGQGGCRGSNWFD